MSSHSAGPTGVSGRLLKPLLSCCEPSGCCREPALPGGAHTAATTNTSGLLAAATTTELPSVPLLHLPSGMLHCPSPPSWPLFCPAQGRGWAMNNSCSAGCGAPTSPTALGGEPALSSTPERGHGVFYGSPPSQRRGLLPQAVAAPGFRQRGLGVQSQLW